MLVGQFKDLQEASSFKRCEEAISENLDGFMVRLDR
jgi:hypothetical protein